MRILDGADISCISLITAKATVYRTTVNQISSNLQTELDAISGSERERGELEEQVLVKNRKNIGKKNRTMSVCQCLWKNKPKM